MNPTVFLFLLTATVGILSVAHRWDSHEQQQLFEIQKRDAVIEVLERQSRQQVNVVQNNNSGLTGKQGK